MLKYPLLHPGILEALARSGHGSQVLIADGNYPLASASAPAASRVHLNLRPGVVTVSEVLATLVETIPVEAAAVMQPDDGSTPPIFSEFEAHLPGLTLDRLGRFEFYRAAAQPSVTLAIGTGDTRLWANILLTIGVVTPAQGTR